ncbi:hypothetical protein NIES21_30380 [Anabaenopsis circularis NIES-21]|uniref:Uncharacterized protein n=1 Tax=Anabaenopsis circularis NIES-21 TaxID=1085406 RepID=A0A1Z4GI65_9CYAN|nr:hypothetical protein NIES21_30380 [Anabaenopsis circularis NIES-21]
MKDDTEQQKKLAKLAAKIISDRQLLGKLTDKVYELMKEDLQQQKERIKN